MKILVVDDNKDICMLIESILLADGYDVDSCCNPAEFKQQMQKAKPKWMQQIDKSFLTEEFKLKYKQIVIERFERIKK